MAALVAQTAVEISPVLVVGDNHSSFAGGHLLVGIKGKHRRVGQRSRAAFFILGPDCFASVFDDDEIVLASDGEDRVHVRRLTEGVDDDNGFGAGGDGRFDFCGVQIAGQRVNVHKNRRAAFV